MIEHTEHYDDGNDNNFNELDNKDINTSISNGNNIDNIDSQDIDERVGKDNSEELNHVDTQDIDERIDLDVKENNNKDEFIHDVNEDELMLSTIDNPFSPKTEYDMWKRWDSENGYNTEEYIARLINMEDTYDADDEFKLNVLINKVISEILENDDQELYMLI